MARFSYIQESHVRPVNLFENHPLAPLAISLVMGISVGHGFLSHVTTSFWLAAIYVLIAACCVVRRHPKLQSVLLTVSFFFLGCMLICRAEENFLVVYPEEETGYDAVVASEPEERGRVLRFDMIITSGPYSGRTVRASLQKDTVECRYRDITVGDGLSLRSVLRPPSNFRESGFDYVRYMKANGISGQTFIYYRNWRQAAVSVSRISTVRRAAIVFLRYRHKLLEWYRSFGLDNQEFAVVSAMTLGYRAELSPELRKVYSLSGVSHILALSGMHLGIIYFLLSSLFPNGRFTFFRELLIILLVWAYVFLVGMSVSVVRSAIMISAFSFAAVLEYERASLNNLAIAALIILIVNPFSIYDVGFQLSFLSVASILVFHHPVAGIVSFKYRRTHHVFSWFWSLIIMSCSAQLATAPLVAYYFGTFSFVFLLSNIVAIPAVTVILYLSLTALALSFVPAVQHLVVALLVKVVICLNAFLFWLSSLPGSSLSGIHINVFQLMGIYVIILSLVILCKIFYRRYFYTVLSM